jgi:hypothetical protein
MPESNPKREESGNLSELKKRLLAGKLAPEDLETLKNLVEKTEEAAKNLRAAIVE